VTVSLLGCEGGGLKSGKQEVMWTRCDEIRHQWNRWLKRAGLFYDGILTEEFGIPKGSCQIHDLRRSFNTYSIEIAGLTQNQARAMMGNDPLVNLEHHTNVIDIEVRRKIENLPFDYRDIPLSDDVRLTKGRRKKHLRLV
jgi:hypothetical protein